MDKPTKQLAILIVEDTESDAQLVVRLLKKADYELVYERVETAEQMRTALKNLSWDIVISDYKLPQFDGRTALKELKETGQDIPFIVVSGTIGEEIAVSMMKAGAHDYLIKGDLARLVPAVQRELEQAEIRRGSRQAGEALQESEDRYRTLVESSPDSICIHCEGKIEYVNAATVKLLHASCAEDLIGMPVIQFVHPDYQATVMARIRNGYENQQPGSLLEERFITLDGQPIEVEVTSAPIIHNGKAATQVIVRDITGRKQSEKALAESEIKFRWLYEYAPMAYHLLTPDGTITDVNIRWCELLGYNKGEAIGRSIFDFVASGEKDEAKASFETKKRNQQPFVDGSERNFLTKDGAVRIFKTYDFFVRGQKQNIISVQTTIEDITERRQAEDALKLRELYLSAIIENQPGLIWLKDLNGRFLAVNGVFAVSCGKKTPAEVAGKTDWDIWPRELAEKYRADDGRVIKQKKPIHVEESIFDQGYTKWFETFKKPIFNATGQVIGTTGFARDITERKQSEEALSASEFKLRALVEQVPAIVYTESAETRETIYISPQVEKLTGYTPDEWIEDRRLWQRITHPEDRDALLAEDDRTSQTHDPFEIEYRILTCDGRTIWIRDEAVIIKNPDGSPLFWQGVMYDITERKQAEENLSQALEKLIQERTLLRTVIDNLPDSIYVKDMLGRKLLVNRTDLEITGFQTEADVLGKTDFEIYPEELARGFDDSDKLVFQTQKPLIDHAEFLYDSNKQIRWLSTSKLPLQDSKGNLIGLVGIGHDITASKLAEEGIRRHVRELEMLYQSGLALSQLLNPREIGQKIITLLEEQLDWRNTRVRLYHPQDDSLELLDFNRPGLKGEVERHEVVERFQSLITHSGQGMSGWVIKHKQPVRSGDVSNDPRYVEAYPGIHSGLYIPMKLGERIIGVISIEDEKQDAFSEADERLIATLANQAASAFETARLFEETRQRVMELETLNRISLALRAVSKQDDMLSIILDEALNVLNTSHGSIELFDRTKETLGKTITRGWTGQVIEPPQNILDGIAGRVFISGEMYVSREFASDPETRAISRDQIPPNWGGIFLPIHTAQQTLGILSICVPSERELNEDEIRLLSTLSEMTGAALQRMQLHEQTVRRLNQLHALRAVDQAISSSRDIRLTLDILLTHTISRLDVDAADVLLLQTGSNMLELVAGRGFHTLLLEDVSMNDSIAGRAIMEHRPIMALDFETATLRENQQIRKLWKEEGFACYWCVPLSVKGEIKGVLEVYRRTAFTPDAEWIEFLEALAGQAAIAIDSTQLFENLQRANMDLNLAYDATIEGWSRALDLRDRETEGHTLRVTELTIKLSRAMHVNESQLTAIRRGALLHDIGKMGIPDAILLKEGALTDEEWVVMRRHPQFAHDMLMPIAYLNDSLVIPYCHHEKWDGTGYPQGLKGDHIPLAARIFAVVDVWDALTNDRTYRKKWTKAKARQHIKEQSGRHFDPQVVDVFLKYIDKK